MTICMGDFSPSGPSALRSEIHFPFISTESVNYHYFCSSSRSHVFINHYMQLSSSTPLSILFKWWGFMINCIWLIAAFHQRNIYISLPTVSCFYMYFSINLVFVWEQFPHSISISETEIIFLFEKCEIWMEDFKWCYKIHNNTFLWNKFFHFDDEFGIPSSDRFPNYLNMKSQLRQYC